MNHCTGLYIVGHFYNRGGYADMAHQYAIACSKAGIPAKLIVTGEEIPEVKAEWESRVLDSQKNNIGSQPTAIIVDIPPRFRLVDALGVRKVIGSTIFEGDSIPLEWVNHCGLVDEVWVPTNFNLETFANAGLDRSLMRKVPLSIDTDFWNYNHPENRLASDRKKDDPVRLLYICSLHRRKGLDKLVEAYFREFSEDDNVNLTISCFPIRSGGLTNQPIHDDESLLAYLKKQGSLLSGRKTKTPALCAHYKYWDEEDLRDLFLKADAYVSTERADGWALPVMQMMSLGKPTMLLGWGGSSEYASSDNAYLIPPGPLEPVDPHLSAATLWYRGQRWPQMNTEDVRAALRNIVNDVRTSTASTKAERSRATVMQTYTYTALGLRIAKAVGWSKKSVTEQGTHNGSVALRASPYIGTWTHSMLSKIRAYLVEHAGYKITVVADNAEEKKEIDQLATRLRIPLNCVTSLEDMKNDSHDEKRAIVFASANKLHSLKKTPKVRYLAYDLVQQILLPFDADHPPQLAGVYLSGGLTDTSRKLLVGRGLHRCPLISHLPVENHPGSWSFFKHRISLKEARNSGLSTIFIADEDPSLQRQSYQQTELTLAQANIFFLQSPAVSLPLNKLGDNDIFRRSLPKRWRGANKGNLQKVVTIPAATTERMLATLITRLSYFLPASAGFEINLPVSSDLLNISQADLDRIRAEYGQDVYGDLVKAPAHHIRLFDEADLPSRMLQADTMHWVWSLSTMTDHARRLLALSENILLVDVDHDGMRSGFSSAYGLYFSLSREKVAARRAKSISRLNNVVEKIRATAKTKIAAFGTGPSLAEAFDHDFSDAITIACNTMVKDRKLLKHIRPSLIVASDADFHFGPSKYAQQFRADLCIALKEHDAMFVCPEAHADLLIAHHPEIEEHVIAVPVDGAQTNYDLTQELRVRAIDNVLLQFLLPLSVTLGKDIKLLGFDGRQKGDKKFWNHNVNTQYPELMETIEYSHPGFFFHRSYTDYFERHCKLIEEYIVDIEAAGSTVRSLADSAVPVLAERIQK